MALRIAAAKAVINFHGFNEFINEWQIEQGMSLLIDLSITSVKKGALRDSSLGLLTPFLVALSGKYWHGETP